MTEVWIEHLFLEPILVRAVLFGDITNPLRTHIRKWGQTLERMLGVTHPSSETTQGYC